MTSLLDSLNFQKKDIVYKRAKNSFFFSFHRKKNMATVLTDLLGEDILQHGEPSQVPTAELDGKTVALYFS